MVFKSPDKNKQTQNSFSTVLGYDTYEDFFNIKQFLLLKTRKRSLKVDNSSLKNKSL